MTYFVVTSCIVEAVSTYKINTSHKNALYKKHSAHNRFHAQEGTWHDTIKLLSILNISPPPYPRNHVMLSAKHLLCSSNTLLSHCRPGLNRSPGNT